MKRKSVFVCMAAALVGAFLLGRAGAEDTGMEDMAAWMELANPGPEHAEMKKSVGNWACEAKMWPMPGAEPVIEKCKVVRTEALGGRFIKEVFEGSMMGMPFTGEGYMGFNKATKKHEIAWMDSMGTGIMFMTGTETAAGTIEYKGSFFGPGGVEVKSRSLVKKIADDKYVMEMHNDMGEGEMKCMEMTYTRAK